MRFLFLVFVLVPIIEMWLLIKVGSAIGAWPTIGLVFLTAFIGVLLLRQQGLRTLLRGNQRLAQGQLPATEMLEGLVLGVCGALLLTPGFMTDAFGFLGLMPWTRRPFVAWAVRRFNVVSFNAYEVHNPERPRDPSALEGEYWREDGRDRDKR